VLRQERAKLGYFKREKRAEKVENEINLLE